LYAYVRNNPITLIDPTGRFVWISGTGSSYAAAKELLVRLVMRPQARAALATLQEDPRAFVFAITDRPLPNSEKGFVYGSSAGTKLNGSLDLNKPFYAWIDLAKVRGMRPGQPPHPDRTGLTTTAHEVWHLLTFAKSKTPEEAERRNREGDNSGAAEEAGKAWASEKPDLSRKEAEKLVNKWLEESAKHLVNVNSTGNPATGEEEGKR
jgi:hypothetical protein